MAFPLAAIGLGTQLIGGIIGNIKAGRERKKLQEAQDKLIAERQNEITAQYAKDISTNYLDTAESKGVINQALQQQEDLLEGMNSNAVAAGATAESKIAATSQLNENFGDLLSGLAQRGTARRDAITAQKKADDASMFGLNFETTTQRGQEKVDAAANFAANMGNLGTAAGSLAGMPKSSASTFDHSAIQATLDKKFKYEPIKF